MKINLSKVASIQLTLAISVIPEDVVIEREGLNKIGLRKVIRKFGKHFIVMPLQVKNHW